MTWAWMNKVEQPVEAGYFVCGASGESADTLYTMNTGRSSEIG